jgi:DNA-binding ferritin-like protein (Dps family)
MSKQLNSRAVFAPDDYATIRKALQVYMHNYGNSLDEEESRKIASLLHRLGRFGYEA